MVRMMLFSVLFLGCADGYISEDPELLVSAELVPPDYSSDFSNCGMASHECSASDTDECVSGWCQCGLMMGDDSNERPGIGDCKEGYDCRFGRCIAVDTSGKGCEFDHECDDGNILVCIEYHCSPTGCLPNEQGELNCNGVDDDCDGCVDGSLTPEGVCIHEEAKEFDVHFMVDPSGSMSGEIGIVTEVMGEFSEKFSRNPAYTFGTTLIPSYEVDGRPELYTDQTDFDTFISELEGVRSVPQGDEPSYDAVYEAGTGELPISWRPGATRILIIFTDEEGHSYRSDFGLSHVDESMMCDALTHGEVLVFFALGVYASDFNACASVFELHQSVEQIMNALDGLIDDPCAP